MKLGLWGARMDNSGLGMQTWEFYNAMKPDKTMVIDISPLERLPERVMQQFPERYPTKAYFIHGWPTEADYRQFLEGLDVVFIAESSYGMDFYRVARDMGVKTAVQYNYEFFDWIGHNEFVTPDMFIAPSTWHYKEVGDFCTEKGVKHVYLHCPVNRDKIPYRRIGAALNFVHVAGRPAAHDRNGTYTFLKAIELAEGDLHGTVYTQDKELYNDIKRNYPHVKAKINVQDYTEIYRKGSVMVIPRKYGGNCLPMNEALSAGMPVIMPRLEPQKDFLPDRWLVDAFKTDIHFAPRFPVDVFECDPLAVMLKMRWFASMSDEEMVKHNMLASDLAETISWHEMEPKYREVFEALCQL